MGESGQPDAEGWIQFLGLGPHPEGGHFVENYRSPFVIPGDYYPQNFTRPHCVATSIYFLLKSGEISHFHRLKSDELWYFHTGDPIRIHLFASSGEYSTKLLGVQPEIPSYPQLVIPAGTVFAAEVNPRPARQPVQTPAGFSLVGCVVAPGFEFADFELCSRASLLAKYPAHHGVIVRFTPP